MEDLLGDMVQQAERQHEVLRRHALLAISIQTCGRKFIALHLHGRKVRAATAIGARYRGGAARSEASGRRAARQQEASAVRIQARTRGRQSRRSQAASQALAEQNDLRTQLPEVYSSLKKELIHHFANINAEYPLP